MSHKKEAHKRSIAKTITWRVLATLTTAILVLLFTGKPEIALSVGAIEMTAKIIIYYAHERAWNRISWGIHHN